jgi:hypothetical protein
MSRSILITVLALAATIGLCVSAFAQSDILLRESDEEVVALSLEKAPVTDVFEDSDNDGVYDAITLNGKLLTGDLRIELAEGFQYQDGRYIVIYPTTWTGLPEPGEKAILGFIHYFDDKDLSTYLAIVAEQAIGDDTTAGLGVFFYDSAGLRVGAPSTVFMQKARLRAVPIYQTWVEMGRDFGIGSNPSNSQFFIYAKDLGLPDDILVVSFRLYQ